MKVSCRYESEEEMILTGYNAEELYLAQEAKNNYFKKMECM